LRARFASAACTAALCAACLRVSVHARTCSSSSSRVAERGGSKPQRGHASMSDAQKSCSACSGDVGKM